MLWRLCSKHLFSYQLIVLRPLSCIFRRHMKKDSPSGGLVWTCRDGKCDFDRCPGSEICIRNTDADIGEW